MGERIGYARVSTRDQNLDMQLADLKAAGCAKIFQEKVSGVRQRPQLEECMNYLREGDTLVVWKLDRLGRSLSDLIERFSWLSDHKVALLSIKDKIDDSKPSGRLVEHIFACLAEFERDLMIERTSAGRKAAIKRGVKFGRPVANKSPKSKTVAILYKQGLGVKEIMLQLSIKSSSTIYRFLRMEGIEPKRLKKKQKDNLSKSLRKSLKEVKEAQNGRGKLLSWDEFNEKMKEDKK